MTTTLIILSTVVVWGICAPAIALGGVNPEGWRDRLWEVAGIAGVLSGLAAAYLLHHDKIDWWRAAFAAAIIAMAIFVFSLRRNSVDGFILAGLVGTFGYLLWPALGMSTKVHPDEVTIPWGGILAVVLVVVGTIYYFRRR